MGDVTIGLWLIVGFCGLLLVSLLFGIVYFVIRRQTIIRVYMPDSSIYTKRFFKQNIPREVNLGNDMGTYIIDKAPFAFYKTFWGICFNFTYGNPNPLVIDPTANMPNQLGYKAQDISVIHDNYYLRDLFSIEDLDKIIMYLVIGCLIGLVVIGILIATKGNPPIEISHSSNNTEYIKGIFKSCISGRC